MPTLTVSSIRDVLYINKASLAAVTIWGILVAGVSIIGAKNVECDRLKGLLIFGICLACVSAFTDFLLEVVRATGYVYPCPHCRNFQRVFDLPPNRFSRRFFYLVWMPCKCKFNTRHPNTDNIWAWCLLFIESLIRLGGNAVLLLSFVAVTAYPWFHKGCSARYLVTKNDVMFHLIFSALAFSCCRFFVYFNYPSKRDYEREEKHELEDIRACEYNDCQCHDHTRNTIEYDYQEKVTKEEPSFSVPEQDNEKVVISFTKNEEKALIMQPEQPLKAHSEQQPQPQPRKAQIISNPSFSRPLTRQDVYTICCFVLGIPCCKDSENLCKPLDIAKLMSIYAPLLPAITKKTEAVSICRVLGRDSHFQVLVVKNLKQVRSENKEAAVNNSVIASLQLWNSCLECYTPQQQQHDIEAVKSVLGLGNGQSLSECMQLDWQHNNITEDTNSSAIFAVWLLASLLYAPMKAPIPPPKKVLALLRLVADACTTASSPIALKNTVMTWLNSNSYPWSMQETSYISRQLDKFNVQKSEQFHFFGLLTDLYQ